MDKEKFYDSIRASLFGGILSQDQVDGINSILDYWCKSDYTDSRWLAYILATVFHETDKTMHPIEESGKGRGKRYGKKIDVDGKPYIIPNQIYYGRGYVQLTWRANYMRFSKRLNIPLLANPDLMLQSDVSIAVLFDGMVNGLFTGVGLGRYFNAHYTDWINARKVVNGLDKAELIAGYAKKFVNAIE
jgi:putative chitinase